MKVEDFIKCLGIEASFFTGVPDSLLKGLCDYLYDRFGVGNKHIIGANEGNCVALAAGHYMATGETPVIYMQNSGIGNIINPSTSLLHPMIYGIPCIFIIGWRGEPGIADEPQHSFQGKITLSLLEQIDITPIMVDSETTLDYLHKQTENIKENLNKGNSVAFVIKKHALTYNKIKKHSNSYEIRREKAIESIVKIAKKDIIVSTTGKASREVFEIRAKQGALHCYDFLTVGSMGHASSIAFKLALEKSNTKVWCIDGDGAAIMHLGSMAIIGASKPANLIHVILNNESHESVGGMPTGATNIDFLKVAKGCGYERAERVTNLEHLEESLLKLKKSTGLACLEIKVSLDSRKDLGRPTTTPKENIESFMNYVKSLN
jgi:phosphonopyruvate decarboxylase